LGALLILPTAATDWDRFDFVVSTESAAEISVASSDGLDAIVTWSAGYPSQVRCRAMDNRAWVVDPVTLGPGSGPRVLVDLLGTFRLFYVSGSSIVTWVGTPTDMQVSGSISAGSQPIQGFAVNMAPDGTIFLVWQQDNLLWWTTDTPDYDGWSLPYQSTSPATGLVRVVPRSVGGVWQPRIYFGSGALSWREYDGAAWGPDVPIPLRVPADGDVEVVLLADGRHAIVYGAAFFCGNYYYEEDASGAFQEQPPLWTFGDGACHVSDMVPMPISATVDATGEFHVLRYEACFEYHDYDLWGCGFSLIWQRWDSALGRWIYAPEDEFPGADALVVALDRPRFAAGDAVFAWSYSSVMLRIMSPSEAGVADGERAAPRLRAMPTPSAGSVGLRWNAPLATGGAGGVPPAVLRIFDARGSLFRAFPIDASKPGQVVWDGRDDRGAPVASGAYFARIVDGRQGRSIPIVLIR
jgi:hypothetical protein